MLCLIKALWLVKNSHATWNSQSEWFFQFSFATTPLLNVFMTLMGSYFLINPDVPFIDSLIDSSVTR